MNKKTAVYTIITSKDDILFPPLLETSEVEFFALTSLKDLTSNIWHIIELQDCILNTDYTKPELEEILMPFGKYDEYLHISSNEVVIGRNSNGEILRESIPAINELLPEHIPRIDYTPKEFPKNPAYTSGKYNGYPLQLSICIPIGNRADTLPKCLDSVLPLLETLDAELIIVDSSSDGSTEIAKKYTDKVIPYVWINDFADARNTAIRQAKGAWIMSLDDDEWFEDVSEIITFFKGIQWKTCDIAYYVVRNYKDLDGLVYYDSTVQRMAKNSVDFHYKHPIHESMVVPSKSRATGKYFKAFVHHYGYVFTGDEDKKSKVFRNINGLIATLKYDPYDLREHMQLVNELVVLRDTENAKKIAYRAMSLSRLPFVTDADHWRKNCLLYLYLIAHERFDDKFIDSLLQLTDFHDLNPFQSGTIYFYLASNSFSHQRYKEACEYTEEYRKSRDLYFKSPSRVSMAAASILLNLLEDNTEFNSLMAVYAFCLYKEERLPEAVELIKTIDFEAVKEVNNKIFANMFFNLSPEVLQALCHKLTPAVLENLYLYSKKAYLSSITSDESGFIEPILNLNSVLEDIEAFENNVHAKLIKMFAHSDEENIYKWFLDNPEHIPFYGDDIALCAVKSHVDISAFYGYLKFEDMQTVISALNKVGFEDFKKIFDDSSVYLFSKDDNPKTLFVQSGLLEHALFVSYKDSWEKNQDEYMKYFNLYIKRMNMWMSIYYNKRLFEQNYFDLLPATSRGAFMVQAAFALKAKGQTKEYIAALKDAVVQCPLFEKGVKLLLLDLKNTDLADEEKEKSAPKTEFDLLGEQLKAAAKQFISSGSLQEAQNILVQLSNLMPGDKEVAELLKACVPSNPPN